MALGRLLWPILLDVGWVISAGLYGMCGHERCWGERLFSVNPLRSCKLKRGLNHCHVINLITYQENLARWHLTYKSIPWLDDGLRPELWKSSLFGSKCISNFQQSRGPEIEVYQISGVVQRSNRQWARQRHLLGFSFAQLWHCLCSWRKGGHYPNMLLHAWLRCT